MAYEKGESRWVDVSKQVRELSQESWKQYWAEMDAAEAIEFLRDPKEVLLKEGLIGEDFRIQVQIVNSEVRSVAGPVCNVLMVFPTEKFAMLTVYRHPNE